HLDPRRVPRTKAGKSQKEPENHPEGDCLFFVVAVAVVVLVFLCVFSQGIESKTPACSKCGNAALTHSVRRPLLGANAGKARPSASIDTPRDEPHACRPTALHHIKR
ncbi:unnamed protein product, partial [Scytosiphon promiscuus]